MKPHRLQQGFTLIEVLVAVGMVAVALLAGLQASNALTRNAQRQADVILAQTCAQNELVRLRLINQMPAVGDSTVNCPQLGRQLQVQISVRPTPTPASGVWMPRSLPIPRPCCAFPPSSGSIDAPESLRAVPPRGRRPLPGPPLLGRRGRLRPLLAVPGLGRAGFMLHRPIAAPPTKRARGFTLIELLVALAAMALVAIMSWRGLDGMIRTQESTRTQGEQQAVLQTVLAQWSADLNALMPLQGRQVLDWDGQVLRMTRKSSGPVDQGAWVVAWSRRNVDGQFQWVRWQSLPARTVSEWNDAWMQAMGAQSVQRPDAP